MFVNKESTLSLVLTNGFVTRSTYPCTQHLNYRGCLHARQDSVQQVSHNGAHNKLLHPNLYCYMQLEHDSDPHQFNMDLQSMLLFLSQIYSSHLGIPFSS